MSGSPGSKLDHGAVQEAYRRWASFYDVSFGIVAARGRRLAVDYLNRERGHILEVGVGTGLSLPGYRPELTVTGIDLSWPMLVRAQDRVQASALTGKAVVQMDAERLAFADNTFDAAAAMFVMTVVPNPATVLSELRRVLHPGGTLIVVNHFSRDRGLRAWGERALASFSRHLGWHPVFPLSSVTGVPGFVLEETVTVPPLGLFTLLRLRNLPAESS